jgi:hypothetical protein
MSKTPYLHRDPLVKDDRRLTTDDRHPWSLVVVVPPSAPGAPPASHQADRNVEYGADQRQYDGIIEIIDGGAQQMHLVRFQRRC